jgi:hypothetical protein
VTGVFKVKVLDLLRFCLSALALCRSIVWLILAEWNVGLFASWKRQGRGELFD